LARRRRRAPSNTTSTSENNSISAGRDPAGSSKHQTTGGSAAAAIKGLFSAAKALLCRKDEDEPPPPARRSGETEKGFIVAVRRRCYDRLRETHRAVTRGGSGKAFGEAANAALLAAQMPEDLSHAGGGYGADLFDPASAYWQDNANNDQWHDGDFSAKQDQYFPQP
jgi:hypothetical protein